MWKRSVSFCFFISGMYNTRVICSQALSLLPEIKGEGRHNSNRSPRLFTLQQGRRPKDLCFRLLVFYLDGSQTSNELTCNYSAVRCRGDWQVIHIAAHLWSRFVVITTRRPPPWTRANRKKSSLQCMQFSVTLIYTQQLVQNYSFIASTNFGAQVSQSTPIQSLPRL